MKLAKNETVVRKWEYAKGSRISQSTATLTLTNKRLIHVVENSAKLERQEIPVDSIKSIYASRFINVLLAIVLIAVGIACFIGSFFLFGNEDTVFFGVLLILVAAALIAAAVIVLKLCSMTLIVTTEGHSNTGLSVGVVSPLTTYLSGAIRVSADSAVVNQLIDELGALIITLKNDFIPQAAPAPSKATKTPAEETQSPAEETQSSAPKAKSTSEEAQLVFEDTKNNLDA